MRGRTVVAMAVVAAALGQPAARAGILGKAPTVRSAWTRERALSLVQAAGLGSPSAILRAMLRDQGRDAVPLRVRPAALDDAPSTLARPIGLLLAAADTAEALRQRGVEESKRAPGADPRPFRVAALTILKAVETAVPALPPSALAATSCPGVAGPVVFADDACERVIVAGDGANVYDADVNPTLLVDLGGDDVYHQPAGVGSGGVGIVVDVNGDDVYETSVETEAAGAQAVAAGQGAGITGVGVLADLAGDDHYSTRAAATAPQPGPVSGEVRVFAQGGGAIGAGILFDGGGADEYEAVGSAGGGAVTMIAQGAGEIGLGALLDLGSSVDLYRARTTSTLHMTSRTSAGTHFTIGSASQASQGAAWLAGAGLLADAGGGDTYDAQATGGSASVAAQGAGPGLAGAGLLVDTGGNDQFSARSVGEVTLAIGPTDPSLCWRLEADANASETTVFAQGAGVRGAGALVDGDGDDTRMASASGSVRAIVEAVSNFNCSVFGGVSAVASASGGGAGAFAQGAGQTGVGALVDLAGDDHNDLEATTFALARAIATSPGPNVEEAEADVGSARTIGQGAALAPGAGVLIDLGGDDESTSRVFGEAREETSEGTSSVQTTGDQAVQGSGDDDLALGWLLDLGGVDEYSSDPDASAGADASCWSNGTGRGRDFDVGPPPPSCP